MPEAVYGLPASSPSNRSTIIFAIGDPQAVAITTGAHGSLSVPFNCTIIDWDLTSDVSSTTTMTIKRRAYGGGAATSIVASAKPSLTAATENSVSRGTGSLAGWTTSIRAGDKLYFEVDTNNNAKYLNVTLTAVRT